MAMKVNDDEKFIRVVERLIDPAEVSNLYFFQGFKRLLPRSAFKKLLIRTSRQTPYMGFVIEPYSLFLFFKLKDIEKAKTFLPDRYELMESRVFVDEEPGLYLGMGVFNTRASTFWGSRLETYLIARDKETGHPSWIFIDILSNTIIAIPSRGVADRNCTNAMFTTNSKGNIFLDFVEDISGRQLSLTCNISNGKMRGVDPPLWVIGNSSIGHKKEFTDKKDVPFAVIFDPAEVEQALDIPLDSVKITRNTLFPDLADPQPCKVLCFPFAQHYIADSPGCHTHVADIDDMVNHYNRIADLKDIRTFSTKNIKRMLFLGMIIPILVSVMLFVLLMMNL